MAQQHDPDLEESSNALLKNSRRCFYLPCFSPPTSSTAGFAFWHRIRQSEPSPHYHHQHHHHQQDRWWKRAFLKIREWSEIVAGPKWKTFIRRFNRNRNAGGGGVVCCGGGGGGGGERIGQFQYDPLSYALNFDEGPLENCDFDDERVRHFSARYAAVPSKTKGSGGGDAASGSDGRRKEGAVFE